MISTNSVPSQTRSIAPSSDEELKAVDVGDVIVMPKSSPWWYVTLLAATTTLLALVLLIALGSNSLSTSESTAIECSHPPYDFGTDYPGFTFGSMTCCQINNCMAANMSAWDCEGRAVASLGCCAGVVEAEANTLDSCQPSGNGTFGVDYISPANITSLDNCTFSSAQIVDCYGHVDGRPFFLGDATEMPAFHRRIALVAPSVRGRVAMQGGWSSPSHEKNAQSSATLLDRSAGNSLSDSKEESNGSDLRRGQAEEVEHLETSHLPRTTGIAKNERAMLASHWERSGLDEHASIASFSRFSLQLMAARAPPELIEGAHKAALDEIRHARLCFGLASGYMEGTSSDESVGGEAGDCVVSKGNSCSEDGKYIYKGVDSATGPGPFPETSIFIQGDLISLALNTALEGCVGETLAAVSASVRSAHASDPLVASILHQIANDEARHAALAWRTVNWAIGVGGVSVATAVLKAMMNEAALSLTLTPSIVESFADIQGFFSLSQEEIGGGMVESWKSLDGKSCQRDDVVRCSSTSAMAVTVAKTEADLGVMQLGGALPPAIATLVHSLTWEEVLYPMMESALSDWTSHGSWQKMENSLREGEGLKALGGESTEAVMEAIFSQTGIHSLKG